MGRAAGRRERGAVAVRPQDEGRLSRGGWEVIRVLVYPSTKDGIKRVSVALVKDDGRHPRIERQETIYVTPSPGCETPTDLAEFIIDSLR